MQQLMRFQKHFSRDLKFLNMRILRWFIDLTSMFDNLISADREGDWEGHLQAVQDLFPVL